MFGTVGQHWANFLGVASYSTSTVRPGGGLRSVRIQTTNTNGGLDSLTLPTSNFLVARFYVYFTTLPNVDCVIGCFTTTNFEVGAVFKVSDSKIYGGDGLSPVAFGSTGVSVTTGTWYRIDLKVDSSNNPYLVDVQVDGVACAQYSTAHAAETSATFELGPLIVLCTCDMYFDDVLISNTLADYPLGDGKVLSYVPDADGTHTATTTTIVKGTAAAPTGGGNVAGATDVFNWLNARPIGGGATGATRLVNQQTAGSTLYAEVDFEPTSETSPPRAVEVLVVDKQATTAVGDMHIKLNDNGTVNVILDRTSSAGVTTDRFTTKQYATMVGGGAWTLSRFNALKMRGLYSADATPDQYWRGAMIEAEFAIAAAPIVNAITQRLQAVKRTSVF